MSDPVAPVGSPGQQAVGTDRTMTGRMVGSLLANHDVFRKTEATNPGAREASVEPEAAQDQPVSNDIQARRLEDSAKILKEYLQQLPTSLEFRADEESGRIVFKVINPVTREVLRQVPPEQVLALARQIKALLEEQRASDPPQAGILFDESR